ncbi:nicotinate-nucleotide diphosphorylase [Polyplosphaeria fusca]|uniref:Nicotinate-nucleotide pyrophosphorylase [carboxylating] n=1 Tax=Polyplosphaeria fusca TaxID=682080 RepID=A0A9P4V6G8_9PLEO|nr:nicotinate-nucleotide diphosphorylase [Polyplosphaeria fusca]
MAPPQLDTIIVDQLSESAVLVSYNTPKRSNAFTPQQYDDLREALVWAKDELVIKVIVVTGRGRHFCAGRAMGGTDDTIDAEIKTAGKLSAVLTDYPKVLVAAVHGANIGWGCTQLSAFDLIYAHQDAFFQTPFAAIGIVPEGGSSYNFPHVMGKAQANALLLAGDRLSAQEAYVGGLITSVLHSDTAEMFLAKVVDKAKRIGGYSGEALRMAKRLTMDAADDLEKRRKAGEREQRDILIRFASEETKANLAKFGKKGATKKTNQLINCIQQERTIMPEVEGAPAHGSVAHLLPQTYKRLVSEWLEEDTPSFDYGGFVVGEEISEAKLLGKSEGIVAGVPFFDEVFRQLDCTVEWHVKEGEAFQPIKHCATVRGPVRKLLLGERVALNTLARCSGVATKSARLLALLRKAGYKNTLAGTRKTTPGFRLVEKYGMLVGGVDSHRIDLSTMTMLKDNHIVAAGSITNAVRAAKSAGGFSIKVEVECQSFEEADEAIAAGADVVMLDNFTADGVKVAAAQLKDKWGRGNGDRKNFLVEVSGGLTEENVEPYVCQDVDIVSTSSIHQGVKHVDFSLKIVAKGRETKKESGESVEV